MASRALCRTRPLRHGRLRQGDEHACALARTSGGSNADARSCLEDDTSGGASAATLQALVDSAAEQSRPAARCRLFLRAARITRRFQPDAVLGMLRQRVRRRPYRQAGGRALRRRARRGGKLDDPIASRPASCKGAIATAARASRLVFGTRWSRATRTSTSGRRPLESRSGSIPRTKAPSTTQKRRVRSKGRRLGSRPSRSPGRLVTGAGENGNAHLPPRAGGDDRGVSSAT